MIGSQVTYVDVDETTTKVQSTGEPTDDLELLSRGASVETDDISGARGRGF